jgi:hypothetical protein
MVSGGFERYLIAEFSLTKCDVIPPLAIDMQIAGGASPQKIYPAFSATPARRSVFRTQIDLEAMEPLTPERRTG